MSHTPQPSDNQGPRGLGYVVLAILVIGGIIVGLNSWLTQESQSPAAKKSESLETSSPATQPVLTKAKLDQLRIGMSLGEVESILGKGLLATESKTSSHVYDIYSWGNSLNGPSVSVTFIDGSAREITADNLNAD